MKTSWSNRLNVAANVAVIAFILLVLFRPGGMLGGPLWRWREGSAARRAIAESWPDLTDPRNSSTLGTGQQVLVEFADYECGACRQAQETVPAALRQMKARLVFHHLPLSAIHPHADGAARASICAEAQGRFPEMHDRLFHVDWEKPPDWVTEAVAAGVADTARFRRCLNDPSTSLRLAQDLALAGRLNIHSTPTFLTRAGMHPGVASTAALQRLLN